MKNHLHYDSAKSSYYTPSYCTFLQSTLYRRYRQELSDDLDIKSITLDSHINGDLTIHLGFRTHLQYPFIETLIKPLPLKETFFSYQVIRINFNLHRMSKNEINYLFKHVFQQLKVRGIASITEKYFLDGLNQYFHDFQQGFIGGNIYEREGYPCQNPNRNMLVHTLFNKETEELYQAVIQAKKDKVWFLLRKGHNPNAVHGHYTMLTAATSIGPGIGKNFPALLAIIKLLIEYGADPNQRASLEKTTEESVVDNSLLKEAKLNFLFDVIRILKASKYARPHIQVHASCQSPMAQLIRESNFFLGDRKARNVTIYGITCIQAGNVAIQQVKAKNNKGITVFTKEAFLLSLKEQTLMYKLFKRDFPWQRTILKESELEDYFYTNFIKLDKQQRFYDLLWSGENLIGFNIAEIQKTQIKAKETIYHRIPLAVGKSFELSHYNRLMTLVSFQRGIILQKKNPNAEIVTGYEAASIDSLRQVISLEFYPFYIQEDYDQLVQAFYPNEEIIKKNGMYYIKDELAYSRDERNDSALITPPQLTTEVCNEFFLNIPGYSLILFFKHNKKNSQKISKIIDPHLENSTLEKLIEEQTMTEEKSIESISMVSKL